MARNEIVVDARRDRVWDVLADGRSYGRWVVGSADIRDVDPGFPADGTRFHHRVGAGPLKVSDHTEVLYAQPREVLKLRARALPLGTATVTVHLRAEGDRTRVIMEEVGGDRMTKLVGFNPLVDRLVHLRNAESLRRLAQMAEGRGPSMEDAAS